jgi:hypothetical protein
MVSKRLKKLGRRKKQRKRNESEKKEKEKRGTKHILFSRVQKLELRTHVVSLLDGGLGGPEVLAVRDDLIDPEIGSQRVQTFDELGRFFGFFIFEFQTEFLTAVEQSLHRLNDVTANNVFESRLFVVTNKGECKK